MPKLPEAASPAGRPAAVAPGSHRLPFTSGNGTRIEPSLISSEGRYMYISNSYSRTGHTAPSDCLRIEVHSWLQLTPGNSVVLLTSDRRNPRIAGRVDRVSVDGHYLWLIQDNGAGRRLFHRPEGYTTFLDSEV